MRSKIALFLAALLFFNIILPTKVFAASVQDQSKPIFGLTADQVVEKYNQLTDQQKDQVLRSLGNTSIFANSLFGNIFNSTFGVLDDAVKKLGDLFFQANGVVYKLGSSALAWVSRLIDKVFNNDLTDVNISQPVVDDLYKNTKDLIFVKNPMFINGSYPTFLNGWYIQHNLPSLPSVDYYEPLLYASSSSYLNNRGVYYIDTLPSLSLSANYFKGLIVNLDQNEIFLGSVKCLGASGSGFVVESLYKPLRPESVYIFNNFGSYLNYGGYYSHASRYDSIPSDFVSVGYSHYVEVPNTVTFTGDYYPHLVSFLNQYFYYIDYYYLVSNGVLYKLEVSHAAENLPVTNNTYYNYIYNIPSSTPLNITNIVSNTAINYDPVENLIQYLPDNYNIEQNFSVVNNYYISSGSAISGQAIDVNIVSPGVIDVRLINPEDLTQQVTNNVSKDIINNTDVNFGDLDFSPSVTVGLNAAKDSIDGIVSVTGSSIVAEFVSGIPPDWLALVFVFLILFIAAGFGMSIIRH